MVADRVNAKRFYGIALFDGKLFESTDGGAHFTERPLVLPGGLPKRGGSGADNRSDRGDDRGGQDRIYTTPGHEGEARDFAFCLAELARMSGQRALDIDDSRRSAVLAVLKGMSIPAEWRRMVSEVVARLSGVSSLSRPASRASNQLFGST